MLRCSSCLFTVALVIASLAPVLSAEKNVHELELKTERAIIFKDGFALIIKRGVATTDQAGEVFTDEVPDAAVLGSFWAVPDEGRLISMLAGWKETKYSEDKQLPCTQPIEILLANKEKHAKVEFHDGTVYSGVIREVLIDKTDAPLTPARWNRIDHSALPSVTQPEQTLVSSHVHRLAAAAPTGEHTLTAISGANFILRSDEGDVLLPVGQVRTILVKDMTTTITKTRTTSKKTKRLTFKFEGAETKQSVSIMYFRPGIRWIPTYRVSLSDKYEQKTAAVALQAELRNEAEDLDDVPVDLVVGVPNFRFRDTPSPLVLEATLRNALTEAVPNLMGNQGNALSNAMYSQRAGEFRGNKAPANDAPQSTVDLPGELTAAGAQDLFVYNLPKITLGKSERIAVPIFTTEVPYRDVYTWDLHLTKQDNDAAPSGSGAKSPLALSKNEVWHQIVLTNTTKLPWTTGAAMMMEGNQPLAQELLTYTPPEDEVRVPLTVSVDTRGSLSGKELRRELNSIQWDGVKYARIDKEMKLNLSNNKSVGIETEITLRMGGKVDQVSHDGDVTLGAFDAADWAQHNSHPAVNNSSSVIWRVKLQPGETFEPSVAYHYFTRH